MAPPGACAASDDCPFVGLRPFTDAHRQYFFGRERETRLITSNLFAARVTVLYGSSGVGKSSVLRAGVLPHLRRNDGATAVVFANWQNHDFIAELRLSLAAQAGEAAVQGPDASLLDLAVAVGQQCQGRVMLIFDQFEEYLLYHNGTEAGRSFERQIARIVNSTETGDVGVLLSLREDALSRLDDLQTRVPQLLENSLRLEHLDLAAARQAIVRPLEVYSQAHPATNIESALVDAIVRQVRTGGVSLGEPSGVGRRSRQAGEERVETAYLQLVLTRLWDEEMRRRSRTLRLDTFQSLGGAAPIVRAYLEEVMDSLSTPDREIASHLFPYLVTPTGAKIAQKSEDLVLMSDFSAGRVKPLLAILASRRILVRMEDPERYEIFHDVLSPAILAWRARFQQEQARQAIRRKARRQIRIILATAAAILTVVIVGALLWFREHQKREQAAFAREIAAASMHEVNRGNTPAGAWLALYSAGLVSPLNAESENALFQATVTWQLERELRAHSSPVVWIAFSGASDLFATADQSGEVAVWRSGSEQPLYRRPAEGPLAAVDLSRAGRHLAIARRNRVTLWEPDTERQVAEWPVQDEMSAIALGETGDLALIGYTNGRLELRETLTGRVVRQLPSHNGRITRVALSGDGTYAGAASTDTTASLYNLQEKSRALLRGHNDNVLAVAFSPRTARAVTAGADGTARVWHIRNAEEIATLFGHMGMVVDAAFAAGERRLATASRDGTVRVWNADSGALLGVIESAGSTPEALSFTGGGSTLAVAASDGVVRFWREPFVIARMHSPVYRAVADPAFTRVAAGDLTGTFRITAFDGASGPSLVLPAPVAGVSFNASGSKIAAACGDGTVRVLDAKTGAIDVEFAHGGEVLDAAFLGTGDRVISVGREPGTAPSRVVLWDAASGRQVREWPMKAGCSSVAAQRSGTRFVVGCFDGRAALMDAGQPNPLRWFSGHKLVLGVALSPEGKQVATAGEGPVRIWDAASGSVVRSLYGHTGWVHDVDFSGTRDELATAGADGTVRLWKSAGTPGPIVVRVHTGAVYSVSFSPGGSHILTAGDDGTVRRIPIDQAELSREIRRSGNVRISPEDCRRYLRGAVCPAVP